MTIYSTHAFPCHSSEPEMKSFAEKLYPVALLPVQQSGDSINKHYATTGIAVTKEREMAGRAILYSGTGITVNGKKTLVLGNYECINDAVAAQYLFRAIEEKARVDQYEALLGPMNGTTWDNYRFCSNIEEGSFFSEMIHLPWYTQQWKDNNFSVYAEYASTIDRELNWQKKDVLANQQVLLDSGLTFRNIDLNSYEEELQRMFAFCAVSFQSNFLYTPTSWEVFREKYIALQKWIAPELVWIAEMNGEMMAFCFCLPDHFCTTEKRLVLKTLARLKHPQLKGLGAVLGNIVTQYAREHNYTAVIHALMHRDNYSLNLSAQFTGQPYKEYELYIKHL